MDQAGWVRLHRATLENPVVCKDGDHLAVWVYLLLCATHDTRDALFSGKRITLKPGQLVTGRKAIAFTLHIAESKVQRVLKTFEGEQQIAQQTGNQNRLVTVLNWEKYQTDGQPNEQPLNNDRTTGEQQVNTYKNDKNVRMKEENVLLSGASPPDRSAVVTLTLNDGSEYPVCQEQVDEWAALYPAVDVVQELRKMRGWLLANPRRRKTARGIVRFIIGWLSKEQDRGGSTESERREYLV